MNKRIKKLLSYFAAACSLNSVLPHNNFSYASEASLSYEQLKDLKFEFMQKDFTENWLKKIANIDDETGKITQLNSYATQATKLREWEKVENFETIKLSSTVTDPQKIKNWHTKAVDIARKHILQSVISVPTGQTSVADFSTVDGLHKARNAIFADFSSEVYGKTPISTTLNTYKSDFLKPIAFYSASTWALKKAFACAENVVWKHYSKFVEAEEQRDSYSRAKSLARKHNFDFKSLPLGKLRKELQDHLLPMYPHATKAVQNYIHNLIGIMEIKKDKPTVDKPFTGVKILNVWGPPGCGKSTLIKESCKVIQKFILSSALKGEAIIVPSLLYIAPDDIPNDEKEVDSKIFGTYSEAVNGKNVKTLSPWAACSTYCDNAIGYFDDLDKNIDKLYRKLWSYSDNYSNMMVVATSNSDLSSEMQLVEKKNPGSALAKAFMSRVVNIYLPAPSSFSYQQEIFKDLSRLNNDPEYSCHVYVSPAVLKQIGDYCMKMNNGMRSKNDLIVDLRSWLVSATYDDWTDAELVFEEDKLNLLKVDPDSEKVKLESLKKLEDEARALMNKDKKSENNSKNIEQKPIINSKNENSLGNPDGNNSGTKKDDSTASLVHIHSNDKNEPNETQKLKNISEKEKATSLIATQKAILDSKKN